MKEQRPAAARSALRIYNLILFQIKAKIEQLGDKEAILEQFEDAGLRAASIKNVRNELLLRCRAT